MKAQAHSNANHRSGNLSIALFLLLSLLASFSGCGYSWQKNDNPWKEDGVERIYVKSLLNNTLKAGVEVPLTSAIAKELARGHRFHIVSSETDADAVIEGEVTGVGSTANTFNTVSQISQNPAAAAFTDMTVAADYRASASVSIRLKRVSDSSILWSQSFSSSRLYPGSNRFDVEGSTSSLINSSQETMTVSDLAHDIASDLSDTLLEAF